MTGTGGAYLQGHEVVVCLALDLDQKRRWRSANRAELSSRPVRILLPRARPTFQYQAVLSHDDHPPPRVRIMPRVLPRE